MAFFRPHEERADDIRPYGMQFNPNNYLIPRGIAGQAPNDAVLFLSVGEVAKHLDRRTDERPPASAGFRLKGCAVNECRGAINS